MNILNSTLQHKRRLYSSIEQSARKKKCFFIRGLIVLSCCTFSPTWADDYSHSGTSAASIQLTGLSIYISPGGLHLGLGAPSYGRNYWRPHLHPYAKQYAEASKTSSISS